jgi:hypothetical protein
MRIKNITIVPLLILLMAPLLSFAQSVVRGPYLQMPAPNSIIIKWRTDIATDSAVGYSVIDGAPSSVSSIASTTEHEVTLNGLTPDTLYNYSIGSTSQMLAGGDLSANGDGEHFFTTPPLIGLDKETRVWVIGDSGTADANAAAVRDAYKFVAGARGADIWLMLGDNAYDDGTDIEYQAAVFDMYPQLLRQVPLWSALGNHDSVDMIANPPGAYPQIFSFPKMGESGGVGSGTENYYSFDYGNIHFISLDSSSDANRAAGSDMWSWLESDLIANTQDWTIAFWHHPPYTLFYGLAMREMRENALPLLELYGADLVLAGHNHSYKRSFLMNGHYGDPVLLTPAMILDSGDGNEYGDGAYVKPGPAGTAYEGTVYVVVGTSGKIGNDQYGHPAIYTQMDVLGSLMLDISGNRLDAAFIDSTGVVQDEFTIIKSPPAVIDIDVDPWSEANLVRPESDNFIPVAILGMSIAAGDAIDFDTSKVNLTTLKLGVGEAPMLTSPWVWDVDGDSETDVIAGFRTQDAGILCGDTEVSLVGETNTGEAFVGTSTIETTDCESLGCHP